MRKTCMQHEPKLGQETYLSALRHRRFLIFLLCCCSCYPSARGDNGSRAASYQSEDAGAFTVASVREHSRNDDETKSLFPLGPGDAFGITNGRFEATNIPLIDYIAFAYKLSYDQKDDLRKAVPHWVESTRFDIQARTDELHATKDRMRLFMRNLLTERFHLKMHQEYRRTAVLALTLRQPGVTGPQLQPHDPKYNCDSKELRGTEDLAPEAAFRAAPKGGFPRSCGGIAEGLRTVNPHTYRIGGRQVSLTLFARSLASLAELSRPVIDKTGLTGTYDVLLQWTPDPVSAEDSNTQAIDFRAALRDQLGLDLKSDMASVEYFKLDSVDMPTAN